MARRDTIMVSKTLYQLGVLTLITALVWVGVGVYVTLNKQDVSVEKTLLDPVTPAIDQKVVNSLTGRLKVEIDLIQAPVSTESGER